MLTIENGYIVEKIYSIDNWDGSSTINHSWVIEWWNRVQVTKYKVNLTTGLLEDATNEVFELNWVKVWPLIDNNLMK